MYEYELEALPEYEEEYEWEFEGEGEWEGEYESEEFFRRLAGLAGQAIRSPALRRVGLAAARGALRGGLGPQVGGAVSRLLPQSEFEEEWEMEGEWESEVNPIRRVYPEALMEHLGHAAAAAESEAEAEAFIGALIPMAARLIPRVAPAIMRAAPRLIRGVSQVARTLRRSPTTRPLVRALPTVVRRTATSMARQAAQGRPVTPQTAVRTLAQQTQRTIGSPQRAVAAYRRSRALDQRYHTAARQ
jgi:hypothetical protein